MVQLGPYVIALLVAAIVSLVVAVAAVRLYPKPAALPLAGVMTGSAVWALTVFLETVPAADATARLIHNASNVGIVIVVASFLLFALEYTGRTDLVDWRTLLVLAIEPALVVGFALTNQSHSLFYADAMRTASGFIVNAPGPLFWTHAVYSYLLVVAATAILLRTALRAKAVTGPQFGALTVAIAAPWLANLLHLFGPLLVALTPVAFSVTGFALYLAMVKYDFMSIAPVARDTLVDVIDDAMFVIDEDGTLIDVNRAFESLFGLEDEPVIGESVDDVLADYPDIREALNGGDTPTLVEVDLPEGRRHLKVTGSDVEEGGRGTGHLFLLHDFTDQRRHQRELERQNEQLDQFASLISHDLRNPLDVAMGRTKVLREINEDESLDDHLEEIDLAHERMRRIIDDVLTLARQGQSISEKERVDLADLAEDAWSHVETDGVDLALETDLTIMADRGRLAQVLENLFRNAIQHGESTSVVTVGELEATGGFFVEDDGRGIPPAEREKVLEAGFTEDDEGTGLGLSIVTNIAEAHGWDLNVTAAEDGGARFEFTGMEAAPTEEESVAMWESS